MNITSRIVETYQEALIHTALRLTGKEFAFIQSIHHASLLPGFTNLSSKQEAWFTAIANKLEATKGKLAVQIIGEKHRRRFQRYRESYEIACFGY